MKLRPDMPIRDRIAVIEEALATVLDRDGTMSVERGDQYGERYVFVIGEHGPDIRTGHSLYEIARELEMLLS
ncbi:MAG: hypothetical protein ACP5DX_04005 [Paracoccaceae bacterium]